MKHELATALAGLAPFSLARPLGLVGLILPLVVWILARTASDSRTIATGTLAIWRLVAERDPEAGNRRRARLSPALWCVIAALVLGALALSGPRLSVAPAARTWRLYLDRRPAMFLRDQQSTRIERALAAARRWLGQVARSGDDVIWICASGSPSAASVGSPNGPPMRFGIESVHGTEPPADWLRAPRIPCPAPDWLANDHFDALWITDREPSVVPRQAVLVLSGGAAVPGPIDASGTTRWDWDGERIVEVPHGVSARCVAIEGELARPLADMLAVWASARGLSIDPSSKAGVALRIRTRRAGDEQALVAGRDGWRARGKISGTAPALDEEGDLETWLAADIGSAGSVKSVGTETRTLITRGAGRVWSAWSSMEEPEGDPAAFAVSIASLFDACVLPAPGVVELRDRLAAGTAEVREPREVLMDTTGGEAGSAARGVGVRLDAWLALAALLAALVALAFVFAPRRSAARPKVAPARPIG